MVKSQSGLHNMLITAEFATDNGKKLRQLRDVFNLSCYVNEPTKITESTATCLDQIISNIPISFPI